VETVKYRTVSITVYPWIKPNGAEYWQFRYEDAATGKQMRVTRSTLAKAKLEALKHAQATYRGHLDFDLLTAGQTAGIQRMLAVDPNLSMVDEFLVWHGKMRPRKLTGEALDEFFAAKESNRGDSKSNLHALTIHLRLLKPFRKKVIADITPSDLAATISPDLSPRSRKNIRAAFVTFFRWCVEREYLEHGKKTAPEKIEKPIVTRGVPSTLTPAELQILFANIKPQYLPWLALVAFAGLRSEEVCPDPDGDKSPLDWSDIHWDRGIIIVQPETAKTKQRRVAKILPALEAFLKPHAKTSGRVGPLKQPSKRAKKGIEAETSRIGAFIGGWKRNAIRHSFISYRAATEGLAQTAMEAGNSESEARKSYNDAKGEDEAKEWFAVRP
jgi:integrase